MKISEPLVYQAIQEEIRTWSNYAAQAVGNATLPPLPKNNNLLKAAIWFNFGLDAGRNLLPSIAFVAGKAALPLWLASSAQKYYRQHYDREMNNAYDLLNKPYSQFSSQVINGITQAERNFTGTTYYRQVKSAILDLHDGVEYQNDDEWRRELRNLIAESGVIVTDYDKIKNVIESNLKTVSDKLIHLHKGAQSNRLLFVAQSTQQILPVKAAISSASCHSIPRTPSYQTPEGFTRIDPNNQAAMAALYASAYALETAHLDYEAVMPCLDTTYAKPSAVGSVSVEDRLASSYLGTVDALAQTFHKQRAGITH
ncbi:hypothetical protein [Halioxenophilus aromaticivorans]